MEDFDLDATPDAGSESSTEPARSSPLRGEDAARIYGDLKALEERFNGRMNADAVRFEGDIKTLGLELGGEIRSLRELIENVEKRFGVELEALRQLVTSLDERRGVEMNALEGRIGVEMDALRQLINSLEERRDVEMKAMEDRIRGEISIWEWGKALVLAFIVALLASVFAPELRELNFQR